MRALEGLYLGTRLNNSWSAFCWVLDLGVFSTIMHDRLIILWSHPYSCLACDLLHDSERSVFLSERARLEVGGAGLNDHVTLRR